MCSLKISQFPVRSDSKSSHSPSREKKGCPSLAGDFVICTGLALGLLKSSINISSFFPPVVELVCHAMKSPLSEIVALRFLYPQLVIWRSVLFPSWSKVDSSIAIVRPEFCRLGLSFWYITYFPALIPLLDLVPCSLGVTVIFRSPSSVIIKRLSPQSCE